MATPAFESTFVTADVGPGTPTSGHGLTARAAQSIEAARASDPTAARQAYTAERTCGPDNQADPSDVDLLRRIAEDDNEALRLFYRRHSGLVYSLACRMLGEASRAEEVLQETFIRVWRAAITFDPDRGRSETWVVTIARNLALTSMRKQRPASLEDYHEVANAIQDECVDPERMAWVNSRRRLVQEAVAQLPDNQRRVVLLAYFDGLTHTEIAERTGEPLGTVKSRLRLSLRRLEGILKATLGDAWDEFARESRLSLG